jgi:hypothetical protein
MYPTGGTEVQSQVTDVCIAGRQEKIAKISAMIKSRCFFALQIIC